MREIEKLDRHSEIRKDAQTWVKPLAGTLCKRLHVSCVSPTLVAVARPKCFDYAPQVGKMRPRSRISQNTTRFPLTMSFKSTRGTSSATAAIGGELRVEVDVSSKRSGSRTRSSRPSCVTSKKTRRRTTSCWSGPTSCGLGSSSSSGCLPRRSKWPGICSNSA